MPISSVTKTYQNIFRKQVIYSVHANKSEELSEILFIANFLPFVGTKKQLLELLVTTSYC